MTEIKIGEKAVAIIIGKEGDIHLHVPKVNDGDDDDMVTFNDTQDFFLGCSLILSEAKDSESAKKFVQQAIDKIVIEDDDEE